MLTQERYKGILEFLTERDAATVTELAQAVGVSESTIRRDLTALDKEGQLRKVYGDVGRKRTNCRLCRHADS